MDIDRRRIPSGVRQSVALLISGKAFLPYQFAHSLRQFNIPGGSHHTFCLVSAGAVDHRFRQKACEPVWSVRIHRKRLSDHTVHTLYFVCPKSAESHQIFHLIKGDLIKQRLPSGIIKRGFAQVISRFIIEHIPQR